ncbi:MAG: hydroxymethylpyrimidine/phosphomethylpyrimidine kinase [Gammaproteobacteria bacterium]|nr:MAG: hydroxymethylpyrimidine/phosphomethylpyrimidine kinase [Gammaproteobacteria bacterium]RKZ39195.1 MAG: hydroxymethylpyrimidine/phosphomethylpyrimidine kinase [Gammaproteobacteria bacterium]RKZ72985.1 MAG: hydroxymethylpyrimidine/phosphomethylpyrimidine kinase [Gammaproteobacteria bacterium]
MNHQPPIVLVFAGNDPSGGAGLCADIQALASLGCHAAPVVTSITVQDTSKIFENIPLSGEKVFAQAEAVLNDMPITACKIGLLANIDIVEAVEQVLLKYPHLPVILDPILMAGSGQSLTQDNVGKSIIKKLLPLTQILTPNSLEARTLTNTSGALNVAAAKLMDYGCQYVCITGTHEDMPTVENILYGSGKRLQSWIFPRLAKSYHGSGCTFAASLAGLLAQGKDMLTAVYKAQQYTWDALQKGYQPGHGQALPNRLYRF